MKALIAMSGGVDSSVAAALMVNAGYECVGVTMKLNDYTDSAGGNTCCSLSDTEDARSVAYKLGMKYYVFNFTDDFAGAVIDRFVSEYEAGRTPNPCIDCNKYMKFDKLYDRAKLLGCDKIVTGHYARVEYDSASGRWLLKRAANLKKDQSYVLYFLTQEQLAHTVFPLGEYASKDEVRALARSMGFVNARKRDSQDICFVPDGNYGDFLESYTGKRYSAGDFVDTQGNVVGRHRGMVRYTIGQRKGLGLSMNRPVYVCAKSVEKNTVTVGDESDLYSRRLIAGDFNWIISPPEDKIEAQVKTRYSAVPAKATAQRLPDGRVLVEFEKPQRALTLGQAAVLYDGDTVLGGGTIERV
ncbi:MAG: tRNA 2-thiouridine(34) synthase MnmA [Oscillospiraceae bacterium]|nr:tRNA 2-thiouridine(34) synthase MnmA [Oscillospiraceae bacterium]